MTTNKNAPRVLSHPGATRTPEQPRILMSIIARTRPQVKPTRTAPRSAHSFGEGIFPARREHRQPYTVADLQWAAETSPFADERYDVTGPSDADLDFAAGCAESQAQMDAGYSLF